MQAIYELNLLAHRANIWRRRAALRRRLLDLNSLQLKDIGYSRDLLEQGVKAWPWRLVNEDALGAQQRGVAKIEVRRAESELGGGQDTAMGFGRSHA